MNNPDYIVPTSETEHTEFKTSFGSAVIELLVAFANTKGGSVYIGIADSGAVQGVDVRQETIQQWINEVKTKTSPQIFPESSIHTIKGKTIVELSVEELFNEYNLPLPKFEVLQNGFHVFIFNFKLLSHGTS